MHNNYELLSSSCYTKPPSGNGEDSFSSGRHGSGYLVVVGGAGSSVVVGIAGVLAVVGVTASVECSMGKIILMFSLQLSSSLQQA